jgi:hypothetical protein
MTVKITDDLGRTTETSLQGGHSRDFILAYEQTLTRPANNPRETLPNPKEMTVIC